MRTKGNYRRESSSAWPARLAASSTLILGLLLLICPQLLTDLVFNICGGILCFFGVLNILLYFAHRDPYAGFNWKLFSGLILLACGIILIVFKNALMSLFPLLFGLAMLISGIIKLQVAMNMRRMMSGRWRFTMIAAGISTVFGIVIIINPFGTLLTLLRVIGGILLVETVQDTLSAKSYKEVIDTHFVN